MRRAFARSTSAGALALVLTFAVPASAKKPKAPEPPPGPPPSATFSIAAVSPSRWTLRVENTGAVPFRVVADARLLSLEVTPATPTPKRGAGVVRCALPADMRPTSDTARVVVVPPGKAYKDSFDPRGYCFSAHDAAALVSGANVVAHFGSASGQFVVMPAAPPPGVPAAPATSAPFAPTRELVASAVTLTDAAVGAPPPTPSQLGGDPEAQLLVSSPPRVDATSDQVNVTVTLENKGTQATSVLFRPENIGFDVTPPGASGGAIRCSAAGVEPIREFVTTLGPRARTSTSLLPSTVCPGHVFDLPGLYEVRPRLDARASAGASIGVRLFAGEVVGPPFLLRLHRGRADASLPTPRVE